MPLNRFNGTFNLCGVRGSSGSGGGGEPVRSSGEPRCGALHSFINRTADRASSHNDASGDIQYGAELNTSRTNFMPVVVSASALKRLTEPVCAVLDSGGKMHFGQH